MHTDNLFNHFLHVITNVGDSGLLTILGFAAAVYFYVVKAQRATLAMSWALVSCIGVMTVLKLGFRTCHQVMPALNIVSPSGHAALSAAVMGTLAAIFMSHFHGWRKYVPAVFALFFIVGISASRIALEYHTVSEVLAGLLVGLTIAACSFVFLRNAPPVPFKTRYLAAIFVAGFLLFYGAHTPAETFIINLVDYVKHTFHVCEV